MRRVLLKSDLHVHSRHSKRPSEWILRKLGCAESYTEPKRIYEIAVDRGMDLVTITDHNTLEGSLEIAHLENTFMSVEVTTYFPEDRCKLHVLVYGLNEQQFDEVSRIRENVFDLVTYLHNEKVIYALAHPLYSVNDRLNIHHMEQVLLLFKNFELNGSRDDHHNSILKEILESLNREDIEFLSNRYDISPAGPGFWRKNLIGGSDDHSSLNIATNYTEIAGVSSVETFLAGIENGKARVSGLASTPKTLAHNLYSIAYQFYNTRFHLDRYISKELLIRFVDRSLIPSDEKDGIVNRIRGVIGYRRPTHLFKSQSNTMQDILLREAKEVILKNPGMVELLKITKHRPGDMEEAWYQFVNEMSEKILKQFGDSILVSLSGANLFDVFHTIGSAGSLYSLLAPYFVAYTVFRKDQGLCSICQEHFLNGKGVLHQEEPKIAHFTDTFHDVNGVALTLKMQVDVARTFNSQLQVITCGPETDGSREFINFPPIGTFEMPEYPDMHIYYPPLLKMLNYCYEQSFTHIHSATPGPIGLTALIISRILKLPIYGTYHTALPQYVSLLTDDVHLEEAMWKYSLWYYNQMDVVFVPSQATGDELVAKGVSKEKIKFYPRGIDIERFHPSKRNGYLQRRYQINENEMKLLYVGRVSKEKNLPSLVKIMKQLQGKREGFHLVVVGNGPFLNEMKEALEGLPVTFTGFLEGEDLAQAYASGDLFVFPSTTDTFGNVVLEAQASGLPVIVTDEGGPKENLVHEETGFIVPAGDNEAFMTAIINLMDNRPRLEEMKKNARRYMEQRAFEPSFRNLWETYSSTGIHVTDSRDKVT